MEPEKFMETVVRECQVRSLMTYSFSKRGLRRFKTWFYQKGKKCYRWSDQRCEKEWNSFKKAFNVKLNED
jgi:hypothetical protein